MIHSVRPGASDGYPDIAFKLFLFSSLSFGRQILGSLSYHMARSLTRSMTKPDDSPLVAKPSSEIVATHVSQEIRLDAAHPAAEWRSASPTAFCNDWRGENPDPGRETQVRILWSPEKLYLRFECRFRELFLFADSEPNGRRDHLWDRDVAEAFLQPDPLQQGRYREFEVSPNGMWIDLDIFPGGRADLESRLERSVMLDERARTWTAEMAIPMRALKAQFDPRASWRANFYRVEGSKEPRAYLAWQATRTAQPNFHVSSAFGKLRFAGAGGA
jgi:alpha-galactosidase